MTKTILTTSSRRARRLMLVSRWNPHVLRQILEEARGGVNTRDELVQLACRFQNRINFFDDKAPYVAAARMFNADREITDAALLVEFDDPFTKWTYWHRMGVVTKNKCDGHDSRFLELFEIADKTPYLLAKRYGFFLAQYTSEANATRTAQEFLSLDLKTLILPTYERQHPKNARLPHRRDEKPVDDGECD